MTGYTKGPWFCELHHRADNGKAVISIQVRENFNQCDEDDDPTIAGIHSSDPTDWANARLIASAPDLLESLIEVLPCLGWECDDLEELHREHELGNGYAELIIRARAAIAKAKGE